MPIAIEGLGLVKAGALPSLGRIQKGASGYLLRQQKAILGAPKNVFIWNQPFLLKLSRSSI